LGNTVPDGGAFTHFSFSLAVDANSPFLFWFAYAVREKKNPVVGEIVGTDEY
jgi:hypothetical protein